MSKSLWSNESVKLSTSTIKNMSDQEFKLAIKLSRDLAITLKDAAGLEMLKNIENIRNSNECTQ